jgi:hypothetical protein
MHQRRPRAALVARPQGATSDAWIRRTGLAEQAHGPLSLRLGEVTPILFSARAAEIRHGLPDHGRAVFEQDIRLGVAGRQPIEPPLVSDRGKQILDRRDAPVVHRRSLLAPVGSCKKILEP